MTRLLLLCLSVGGEIQSLAWDPTGERLAVLLKGFPTFLSFQINVIHFASRIYCRINLLLLITVHLFCQVIRRQQIDLPSSPSSRRRSAVFSSCYRGQCVFAFRVRSCSRVWTIAVPSLPLLRFTRVTCTPNTPFTHTRLSLLVALFKGNEVQSPD